MNCHLCNQLITPGEPTKPVGRQGRVILEAHIDCAALNQEEIMETIANSDIAKVLGIKRKPKTFKSFAEAVAYIDKNQFPKP